MTIVQFTRLFQNEQLETVIAEAVSALDEQIPTSSSPEFSNVHLVSLVRQEDVGDTIINQSWESVSRQGILDYFEQAFGDAITPGFDPDKIVGTGTTVTL